MEKAEAGPAAPPAATTPLTSPADERRDQPASGSGADASRPQHFEGEVATTNALPARETLGKVEQYSVVDRYGKWQPFQSLYSGHNAARRVLVVFVRHFFCGNCQEFLRTLSEAITPEALLELPVTTSVVVVGCGDPALIDMYAEATGCRFPIYTDPTAALFNELGMVKTLALGSKPAYMRRSMALSIVSSIGQALRSIPSGLALKSGDQRQVGGEFLLEPVDVDRPVMAPRVGQGDSGDDDETDQSVEEKKVTWCHRMKTTRDHAEIPELMDVLGLKPDADAQDRGQGLSAKAQKRWSKAVLMRKGAGHSLAGQTDQADQADQTDQAGQAGQTGQTDQAGQSGLACGDP